MASVKIEPISAEAFAPFGQLLPAPETGKARIELIEELQNLRATGKPRLSLAAVDLKPLPLTAVEMERHIFSSQAFVPYDCDSYLVLVAPHGPGDGPEVSGLKAFRVPGTIGINYRANTWHHPLTALNSPARFVVLTFVDGSESDEQFVALPEAITIVEGKM
jgi:ureidoglycolate lyase